MNDVPIDQQHLIIPEIVMEKSFPNVEQLMQPIFDSIWDVGYPRLLGL